MTTKQIAEAVGKNPATVARWVNKVSLKMREVSRKVQEAKATSKPADYDLDETCAIIEAGMGANAAGVYRASAQNLSVATLEQTDDGINRAFKAAVAGIYQMLQVHESRITTMEASIQERAALLPPPGKTLRAELNEAVRSLAAKKFDNDFRRAWSEVHKQLYYRCNINVAVRAKNEGVRPVDILEREDLLATATSIAVELQA